MNWAVTSSSRSRLATMAVCLPPTGANRHRTGKKIGKPWDSRRLLPALLGALLLAWNAAPLRPVSAQTQPQRQPQEAPLPGVQLAPIQFSKVKMPKEKIAKARGYLPIRKEQFDRLIHALEAPDGSPLARPHITSAHYTARFSGDALVDGEARLKVNCPKNAPAAVALTPCSLRIQNARQLAPDPQAPPDGQDIDAARDAERGEQADEATASDASQPFAGDADPDPNPNPDPVWQPTAVGTGPDGNLMAILDTGNPDGADSPSAEDKDGDETIALLWEWSATGEQDASGSVHFHLALPQTLQNAIVLLVPEEFQVTCDRGVIASETDSLGVTRWSIAAGSASKLHVTVTPLREFMTGSDEIYAVYRQHDRVDVSLRGVEASASLHVDWYALAPRAMELHVGVNVRIRSITIDGEEQTWSRVAGSDLATILFPTALSGGEHRVRIVYTAPAPESGTFWQLPRVYPTDMAWQDGGLLLTVTHPLEVRELNLEHCRQVASVILQSSHGVPTARSLTASPPLRSTKRGQQMEFAFHRESPGIVLRVAAEETRIRARTGNVVTFGNGPTPTAVSTTQFELDSGQRFELKGVVTPDWEIENVLSTPAGFVEEWSLGEAALQGRPLLIRLAQPLRESGRLELQIHANRIQKGNPRHVSGRQLRIVQFQDVLTVPGLFVVRGQTQPQMEPRGRELVPLLSRDALSLEDEAIVDARRGDLIFRDMPGMDTLTVRLTEGLPEWQANLDVRSMILPDAISETITLTCRAEGVSPEKIHVQTWPKRRTPIQWALAEGKESRPLQKLTGRRLTDAECTAAGYDHAYDVWEVQLPDADRREVTIAGTRQFPLFGFATGDDEFLTVASTPRSATQRATCTLAAAPGDRNDWQTETELIEVPLPPSDQPPSTPRAVDLRFASYLVNTANLKTQSIQLKRIPPTQSSGPAIWIESAATTVRLREDGAAACRGVYQVQNMGIDQIQFALPEDVTLRRALLDGQPVSIQCRQSPRQWSLAVPANMRLATLVLEYSFQQGRMAPYGVFQWHRPIPEVPELRHMLQLKLPDDYRLSRGLLPLMSDSVGAAAPTESVDWLGRWFGPLAGRRWLGILGGTRPAVENATPSRWTSVQIPEPLLPTLTVTSDRVWDDPQLTTEHRVWVCPIDDTHNGIRWYRESSFCALGWGTFLLFALAGHLFRWRLPIVLIVSLVFAMVAGWVALEWIPLARGGIWGPLLGYFWQFLPTRRESKQEDSVLVIRNRVPAQVVGAVLLALALSSGKTQAETVRDVTEEPPVGAEDQPAIVSPPPFRVLFPVDDKGDTTSSFVYLPTSMYDLLIRFEQSRIPVTERWIVRSVRYTGQWESRLKEPPRVNRLDAAIRVTTMRPGVPVEVPFSKSIVTENQRRFRDVRLNGQPIMSSVSADGQSLLLTVDQAGDHVLQLTLDVTPQYDGWEWVVDVPVVATADNQLEILEERSDLDARLVTDSGTQRISDQRTRLAFGPTRLAELRWRSTTLQRSDGERPDVQQLSWLRVYPGIATYEVRFVVQDDAGLGQPPDQIQIAYDSRLRRIPQSIGNDRMVLRHGANLGSVETLESSSNRRVVKLRRDPKSTALGMKFVIERGNGIGEIRLPAIEVPGARIVSELIANSISPALLHDRVDREAPDVKLSDFARAWGTADDVPDFVVRRDGLVDSEAPAADAALAVTLDEPGSNDPARIRKEWVINTFPRGTRMTGTERMTAIYGHRQMELRYQADVTELEGLPFQYRLHAPKRLNVTRVSVQSAGNEATCRWNQSGDGSIRVFVFSPVPGQHRITVSGVVYPAPLGQQTLPVIRLEDCSFTQSVVTLRRQSTTRVRVIGSTGSQRMATPGPQEDDSDGLFVARWIGDGSEIIAPTVSVKENRPRIKADMLTTLYRQGENWHCAIEYACTFRGGVPDRIPFRVPQGWAEQLSVDPDVKWELDETVGGESRWIVVPELPDDARSFRFTMHVPLDTLQRAAMPAVLPLGNEVVYRWLQLPDQIAGQQVEWELRGTEPEDLPEVFSVPKVVSGETIRPAPDTETYRLMNDQASAALRRIESPAKHPKVLFESIQARLWGHRYEGIATWDLDPDGARNATLSLPGDCRCIAVTIDGNGARLRPLKTVESSAMPDAIQDSDEGAGANESVNRSPDVQLFEVDLGGLRLAQRMTCRFEGQCDFPRGSHRDSRMVVPRILADDQCDKVWEIATSNTGELPTVSGDMVPISEGEFARSQLDAALQALQSPDQDIADYSAEELTAWFTQWRQTVRAAARQVAPVKRMNSFSGLLPTDESSDRIDGALRAASARLGIDSEVDALDVIRDRFSPLPLEDQIQEAWRQTMDSAITRRVYFRAGTNDVRFAHPAIPTVLSSRLWVSLGLLTLGGILLRVLLTPFWRDLAIRWSPGLLLLAGVACILFLRWPLLGIVPVFAGVYWAWRMRRSRPETKQPVPHS